MMFARQGLLLRKLRDSPSTMCFEQLVGSTCHVFFFQPRKALYLSHPPHCQAKRCPGASIGAISKQ